MYPLHYPKQTAEILTYNYFQSPCLDCHQQQISIIFFLRKRRYLTTSLVWDQFLGASSNGLSCFPYATLFFIQIRTLSLTKLCWKPFFCISKQGDVQHGPINHPNGSLIAPDIQWFTLRFYQAFSGIHTYPRESSFVFCTVHKYYEMPKETQELIQSQNGYIKQVKYTATVNDMIEWLTSKDMIGSLYCGDEFSQVLSELSQPTAMSSFICQVNVCGLGAAFTLPAHNWSWQKSWGSSCWPKDQYKDTKFLLLHKITCLETMDRPTCSHKMVRWCFWNIQWGGIYLALYILKSSCICCLMSVKSTLAPVMFAPWYHTLWANSHKSSRL